MNPIKINWFIPPNHVNRFIPDWLAKPAKLGYHNYDQVSASVWLRCLQLIPYLEKKGVRCRVNDFSASADISVFVRWQNDQAYDCLQQRKDKGEIIIFDQCVNYLDVTGTFPGNYGSTEQTRKEFLRMAKLSDAFTCPSEFIRQRAAQEGILAHYIPESVDLRHFKGSKTKESLNQRGLTAIWSGQPIKVSELNDLIPLLEKRNISLVLISEKKPEISGKFNYLSWSYYTFPQTILNGDFCLSPRKTDNPYDLGHSHFKIGVFMAQGIPALASPLPSYLEVIQKTGGGKICESNSDWESALDCITENRNILWEWSQAARKGMIAHYSTENVVKQYIILFEQLLGSKAQ
ncbi:MAG: glycosyltransferase [SAR324 cluster bacterium]|nr:glycosyltransferase [SAR324 cluster bacterium]